MASEGSGAQQKLIPVWLPADKWEQVYSSLDYDPCTYELKELVALVRDAIEWAENR